MPDRQSLFAGISGRSLPHPPTTPYDQDVRFGTVRQRLRDYGELLFLREARDSETDAILARAADTVRTPTFSTSENATTDWSSVEAAAQHWAALFRTFLDQILSH